MKKNVLYIMLALCMLFGLMFTTALSVSADETQQVHSHCYCVNAEAVPEDHVCEEGVTWEVLASGTTVADGGHYYLEANLAKGITIATDIEVTICLNGHNLYAGAPLVLSNGTVNICNCQSEGRIYSTNRTRGTTVLISSTTSTQGTVNLYSGSISGAAINSTFCRGVEVKGGVFNMYGGKVVNGRSNADSINDSKQGMGGNVCVYNFSSKVAKFNMFGGTVTGGQAANLGGNIYVEGGKFIMNGGTVTGGMTTATPTEDQTLVGWGGNIFVTSTGAAGTVTLNSGTVAGGQAVYGGNIAADGNNSRVDLTIAGAAVSGGTASADGGNLYLNNTTNGVLFNMTAGTVSNGTAVNGGNMATKGIHPVTLSGGSITGGNASNGGSIYLNNSTGTVTLSGTEISGGNATGYGGNIFVLTGELTISGGSITDGHSGTGGNLFTYKQVNLNAGTISGGTADGVGGNVYLSGPGAKFYMADGTITGGTAGTQAGNLYALNSSDISMTGGTISNGTAETHGGNLYITHTEKVDTRKLVISGVTVTGGKSGDCGGNMYLAKTGKVTITNAEFLDGEAAKNGNNIYMTGNGTVEITGGTFTAAEGVKSEENGGNLNLHSGTVTITNAQITGGDANRGGAVYVGGSAAVTLDGCTVETAGANTGKCIYVAANGQATVKDSDIKNLSQKGTAVWNLGSLKLQGTVNLPDGNLDMVFDGRNESGAAMDIADLTQVDEPITIRRFELDAENDDCGLLATGATAQNANVFQSWMDKYIITYNETEGALYLALPAVHAKSGNTVLRGYESLEAALAETEDIGAAWYTVNTAIDGQTIDKSMMLDLNGQTLTNMTVNEGVELMLIDHANDGYDAAACGSFSGTINGQVTSVVHTNSTSGGAVCHYVVLKDSAGTYTAHRFVAAITHMSLKPAKVALGFKAVFSGDEVARAAVSEYGYELWVNDGDANVYTKNGTFENGESVTLRLQNILSENAYYSQVGAAATIYGNAFITFKVDAEGTQAYACGHANPVSTSLKTMLESVNAAVLADPAAYNQTQMSALQEMINTYSDYMAQWAIEAITAWSAAE